MQPLVHISKLVPTAQNPSLFKVTDSRDAQDPEAGDGSFVERRHPYVETLPHEPSAPATLQTELAEATAIRNNSIHNGSPSPPSYESVNASPEDWSHDLLLKALLALIQQDTDISRYLLKEDGTIETSVAPAMHPLPAFLISFGTTPGKAIWLILAGLTTMHASKTSGMTLLRICQDFVLVQATVCSDGRTCRYTTT
ncbi:unnamed protein product [Peniophora sp. CBMAI 1063]|nr:unnamed protein product [Peniophora sp. CBMAI 1063]